MLLFLALMACQKGGGDTETPPTSLADADTDADADADADADTDTDPPVDSVDTAYVLPTTLFGTPPDAPLAPPTTFVATNRDGTVRGPTDLMEKPTVMWFYPAAATGG